MEHRMKWPRLRGILGVVVVAVVAGLNAGPAQAAFPVLFVAATSATPGAVPLVPSNTPGPTNEVTTVVVLRDDNVSPTNATNIAYGSTLPTGAVFVGNPSLSLAGGGANSVGTCVFTTTSFHCTGASLGAGGDNLTITTKISITPAYGSPTFTEPFDQVTFDGPTAMTLDITGIPPVPVGSPNLSLTKTGAPSSVVHGSNVTYTLTETNSGLASATAPTITDTLPAGETFVSSASGCTPVGQTVTCPTPDLAASSSFQVTFVASTASTPAFTTPSVMQVDNATVSTTTTQVPGANNDASFTETVLARADLSLTKTAAPATVLHGQAVSYTVTVSNAGLDSAQTPTVTDTLPAGQTFMFSDAGCTAAGSPVVVTCNLADLPASSSDVIHITASTAGIPAPLYAPLVQTNTASVSSPTADPTVPNNASAQVTVVPAADLTLSKSGAPNPVIGGQDLVYTLTATNLGPDPALSPTITDTLPAGEVFDAEASSPGCSAVGSVVTCAVPTTVEGPGPGNYFDAGATATFTIAVTPTNTGSGPITDVNTATISSATADPNLVNNTGTATITVSTSCTQTITGSHVGTIIVPAGTFLCLSGATQTGAIDVDPGGGLTLTGATVKGAVETDHATFVTICGSTFPSAGAVLIQGTALLTRVGDDDTNCPGNRFTGSVTVENSVGGVEVFGNTIRGALAVTGNTSATPAVADDTPEVEGNTVGASIECKANTPAPVDDGQANTAAGAKLHQCASL